LKLYDRQMAPNPRRVRIFLAEKGVEVPTVQVNLGEKENLDPEFLAINPLGRVPVIELDDGTALAESVAICRYFEEIQPEPPLMGTDPQDRAVVEMWQRRMESEVMGNVTGCFRNTHDYFKDRITQVPEYGELCRENGLKQLGWLDEVLADREFVAGERYTIADITALVAIDFGRITGIRIGPTQKNLTRWYDAASSRPSAQA